MKVGFLSVGYQTFDNRTAQIAMFDCGHTADLFVTAAESEIDGALNMLRSSCDAIVIDGNVKAFYDAYSDTLSLRPDHFELDGKLHSVCANVTEEFLTEKFLPLLNKKMKKRYAVMIFKTYGKSVDELKVLLKEFMTKKSKVQLGFFEDFLECEVHARCVTSMSKEDMNELSDRLVALLRGCCYAYENVGIAERVAQILKAEKYKLKIAESFTGGAIGAAFTALPGASEFLIEDVVTYSVVSKNKRLGIPYSVIAEKGVVSGDTAYNMALGLMSSGDCDIAVATTGNAGPTAQGGAVGLCYVALGITKEKSIAVVKYTFNGDREHNIKSGVKNALFLLYESLVSYRMLKKQRMAQEAQQPVQPQQQQQPQVQPPQQPIQQQQYVPQPPKYAPPQQQFNQPQQTILPFAPTVQPADDGGAND